MRYFGGDVGEVVLRYDNFADEPVDPLPQGQFRLLQGEGVLGVGQGAADRKREIARSAGRVPGDQKGEKHSKFST